MLNCGAVMLPKGFTLLIPLIAVWTAEFAVVTSFWIDVRRELNVLVRKVLIWRGCQMTFYSKISQTHFLCSTYDQ